MRLSVDTVSLDTLNNADRTAFMAAVGEVMELAPWVADEAYAKRPFAGIAALYQTMTEAVRNAGVERQRALINGHPDLAGKAARKGHSAACRNRQTGGHAVGDLPRPRPRGHSGLRRRHGGREELIHKV